MTRPVKPRPKPRLKTREGKPPTTHEGAENPDSLPMLRTSERRDFKRCPQRWQWGWRDGLKVAGPPNDKLWFGTGWHEVMAHWYGKQGTARGSQPLKMWRDWIGEEIPKIRINFNGHDEWREEVYVDAAKLGEAMIGNYLDTYGKDPKWSMIQVEKPFEVILTDTKGVQRVLFCGTYDGVYRDLRDDTIWLLEHKTAKAISTNHLTLDDQAGGYLAIAAQELAAAGLIPKGKQIKGIMYNFVRKSVPSDKPRNADGLVTNLPTKADFLEQLEAQGLIDPAAKKWTLPLLQGEAERHGMTVLGQPSANQPAKLTLREPIIRTGRERNNILLGMQAEVEHMEAFKGGLLPLYKNPTKDCSWDCNFYNMCVLHGAGGTDWEDYRKSVFRTEDPYADHRKTAAELESF